MTHTRCKAYIFDLDGTLLDTLADLVELTNAVMVACGCPTHTTPEVASYVGNGARCLLKKALPEGADEERVDEAFACWRALNEEYGYTHTRPYAGIPEVLAELKSAGMLLGVLSNKRNVETQKVIADQFPGVFDIVRGECAEFPRKPNPQGMLQMIEMLGVSPDEVFYIGDSAGDMEAARNAGVRGIGVLWGYQEFEGSVEKIAYALVDTPSELLRFAR